MDHVDALAAALSLLITIFIEHHVEIIEEVVLERARAYKFMLTHHLDERQVQKLVAYFTRSLECFHLVHDDLFHFCFGVGRVDVLGQHEAAIRLDLLRVAHLGVRLDHADDVMHDVERRELLRKGTLLLVDADALLVLGRGHR